MNECTFWATYLAVLAAEILGDNFLYTTGVLSSYRTFPIMIGIAAAFMVKMGAAVAVGDALARLPRLVVAGVTTSAMIALAVRFWRATAPIVVQFRSNTVGSTRVAWLAGCHVANSAVTGTDRTLLAFCFSKLTLTAA